MRSRTSRAQILVPSAARTSSERGAIHALAQNYFLPSGQMYRLVRRNIVAALDRGEPAAWQRFKTYVHFWLSSLYVVCEGYRELGLKDPLLDELIELHIDDLRKFRNGSFHFQKTPEKQMIFIRKDGVMEWADLLHCRFKGFFMEEIGGWVDEDSTREQSARDERNV